MRISELFIIAAFGVLLLFALIGCPYEEYANFNPVEWLTDLINGFLNLMKDLFFGWMP